MISCCRRKTYTGTNCNCSRKSMFSTAGTKVPSKVRMRSTIRWFAQWNLILAHLQHSKFNYGYIPHSPCDAWNTSLVACAHGCAIACSLNKHLLSAGFFKENVRYPVWTCRDPISYSRDPIFSDSRDPIFSDSRDPIFNSRHPIFNSRDPIRVPKTS